MTPPTVNAYYNPLQNDINFPAGILQPPFFDLKMDDGDQLRRHRRGHRPRADPRLRRSGPPVRRATATCSDWWTPRTTARSSRSAPQCVVNQYAGYAVADDLKLNGKLTLGENSPTTAACASRYMALLDEPGAGQQPAQLDGFTPEQRFFLGWGQVWCARTRPEAERLQAQTDPHSPATLPRERRRLQHAGVPEGVRVPGRRADGPRRKACRVW